MLESLARGSDTSRVELIQVRIASGSISSCIFVQGRGRRADIAQNNANTLEAWLRLAAECD